MKKNACWVAMALLAMASCGSGNEEVKNFASKLAEAAKNNQKDSVVALYPDAAKCDSFALDYNADSLVVEEVPEREGTYLVKFGGGKTATLVQSEDGTIKAVASQGLFAYAPSQLAFADATGWVEKGMNDAQMAERLSDTLFVASLKQTALNQVKSGLTVKDWTVDFDKSAEKIVVKVDVSNNLDAPVKGTDYSVTSVVLNGGPILTKKLNGVDIEAGGVGTLSYRLGTEYIDWFKDARNTLQLNVTEDEALYRFYKADGNEYKRYVMSQNK